MQNDILDHLKRLRVFLVTVVERAAAADLIRDDDWPEYTSHVALLAQLIDGAPAPKPHTKEWAVARAAFMNAVGVSNCGCGLPATRSDRHGYPICDTCNDLLEQAERKGLPQ